MYPCIPKFGSLLCIDREILNMEYFFHKQYGTFIPQKLTIQTFVISKPMKL